MHSYGPSQSRVESGFAKDHDPPDAARDTPTNHNRGKSKVDKFLGESSKAFEFLWPPNARHGTLVASAQHLKPPLFKPPNGLFSWWSHLVSRCPRELHPKAMPQVESFTQRIMRHYAILSHLSCPDKPTYISRHIFATSSPQSLAKAPSSAPPPGSPLETSSDGESY
jgi:hypothetical protein